tara:strand:- start:595 stop:816 length:222 start_codon:yes stop_codon:yes gene_type:complete
MAIITPNKFALLIENMVRNKRISHWEAVLLYCKDNDVDPAGMGKLINKSLKERLEVNAMDLRLLKEQVGKLPV